jgi:hypothetical protein
MSLSFDHSPVFRLVWDSGRAILPDNVVSLYSGASILERSSSMQSGGKKAIKTLQVNA